MTRARAAGVVGAAVLGAASVLGAACLGATCLGATGARALDPEPIPWPGGIAPSALEIDAMTEDALALGSRERADVLLEASERGEDREHFLVVQDEIDAGRWDLARLFRAGDALFAHRFTPDEGLGRGPLAPVATVHLGARSGPDSHSCADCHSQGGPDGAGSEPERAFVGGDGDRESSAAVRDAPAVLGLGLVQALAAEISAELAFERDEALALAAERGSDVRVELASHDVGFGALVAHPDGTIDASEIAGVDPDLVVRPFGWRGTHARLRRFVEEAARFHLGIQSHVLALEGRDAPDPERLGDGASWWDPDGDGVARELEEGTLTAIAVYLAMLEVPVILAPSSPALQARWAHGEEVFGALGCGGCHRESLVLRSAVWREMPDTTAGEGVAINLVRDGNAPRGTLRAHLFSDLRRHAMGAGLADHADDGTGLASDVFLTRPLWGLAETAPYLHDGRAATIPEAILAHGGEAQAARDAFAAASEDERIDLHVFLLSLTRTPRAVERR